MAYQTIIVNELLSFILISCSIFGSNEIPTKLRLNSGRDIPVIGIGMGGFKTGGPPKGKMVRYIIRTAIDAGYRHIDTASDYLNEEEIGRAINELIDEGKIQREDLFVTTKVLLRRHNNTRARAEALGAIQIAIQKLNISYVDLMLIHYPSTNTTVNSENWKGLEDALNLGLVKSIGVSNFDIPLLQSLFRTANILPAVNQVESHPLLNQKELFDFCSQYKIRLIAWSPLGAGRLVHDPIITEIGQSYNKTAAQVMIRWHLQRGFIAIPKSTNEKRIRENINVFDFSLNEEDMKTLNDMYINSSFTSKLLINLESFWFN